MVRTRLVILPLNTVQSVPPMKHYRTGSLSLDAHGESSDKNARATDNAADDLFMSSQASLSYFLYIFMSSCNFLISFWCRKSVLKQQIHCKSMFNCQKISRLRRAIFFFANLTFILVLDINFFFYFVSFILVLDIMRTYQMPVKMFARIR